MEHPVALVLDQDFSTRLTSLAAQMPVWILSTDLNDLAVQAVRPQCIEGWVTTLKIKPGEDEESRLARALYAIDEHHGEASQSTPYDTLFVYGTSSQPSAQIMAELGFKAANATSDGYQVVK